MKKILFMTMFLLMLTDIAMAYNPPKGMADVLRRSMNSSAGKWLAKFGHVAIYNSSNNRVLEVTTGHGVIRYVTVSTMTKNGYKGARFGKANYWQGYQALRKGYTQKNYRPKYSWSPYYTEGGWGYTWKFKWNKGFLQELA